jgi:GT2 family glycosyltransferase
MSDRRFTVVICSRDRPAQLEAAMVALDGQSHRAFDVLVVDQSAEANPVLEARAARDPRVRVLHDDGRGLSRARNLACSGCDTDWVVFVDDDCRPEPDWAKALGEAMERDPEVELVSGAVTGNAPTGDYVTVTTFPVPAPRTRRGRWTRPWDVGLGVCMAVRRSAVERLGGWDERLGPGAADFPAADDMDFNYRFLKGGGVAYATPDARACHDQWRTVAQLGPLFAGYLRAWSAFAMKHLRSGDVVGGIWLWSWGLFDVAKMFASSARRRSLERARIGWFKLRGLVAGTTQGLAYDW